MPLAVMFGGAKKKADAPEEDADEGAMLEEAAQELIDAIQSGSAQRVATAWKAMPCPGTLDMEE